MKKDYKTNQQKERLEAYQRALDEAFKVASDPDVDRRTSRMLERLDARIEADAARRRHFWKVMGPVAAVACLLVVSILAWWKQTSVSDDARSIAYENKQDEVRRISLPDGTSVCLQNGTVLCYAEIDGMRQAELCGEAYFDVARDTIHPFIIKTATLDLRVLGTAFSVSAMPGYSKTDVILERGSVRLQSKNGASLLRLTPNQKAVYDASTGDVTVDHISAKSVIQQEYGMASFENARVDEILRSIETQYGIKVDASGYDPTKRYNMTYFRSESASDVLALLEALTGGHFFSVNSI